MKSKTLLYIGVIICSILLFSFQKNEESLLKLLAQLDNFTTQYAQEKVYVQSDKPYYAIGDNIWFKAYTLNTKTQMPTNISKTLYVELIGEDNTIKNQIILPLNDGVAWGDFNLPDTLTEGNYRIRAYTNYMRNFSSDFFFDKTIKIGNARSNQVFVNTSYTLKKQNSLNFIDAEINFKDSNNQPMAEKNISYEFFMDGKKINQVTKKADERGNTRVSFPIQKIKHNNGKIVATLNLSNKEKVVKIIPIVLLSTESDVKFLPESGELIEGHPQKTAIKVIGINGKGINAIGEIIDQNDKIVGSFRTDFLGMGSFFTNLKADGNYRSRIKFDDGSLKTVDFPKVKTRGYTLTVNNSNEEKIAIRLTASPDLANGSEVKIIGQQAGNVRFAFNAKMNGQTLIRSISKERFTTGIAQITLLSEENQPLAERLIFINNKSSLMELDIDKVKISKVAGGKSEIKLSNGNYPLKGSFSVSVTNDDFVTPDLDNENNIITSLLLTGDLTGYIENPNHYFLNRNNQSTQELDNLMLTQGWRRFSWKNILENEKPKLTYQAEISLPSISGSVTRNRKRMAQIPVFLMSKNSGDIMRDTLTDAHGKFVFDKLNFADSTQFLVQIAPIKKSGFLTLKIDSSDNQSVQISKNIADIDINVNGSLMKYIKASDNYFNEMTRLGLLEKSIKLDDVTISRERLKQALKYSTNYNGPGNADRVITSDDIPLQYSTLSQFFSNMRHGVKVVNGEAVSFTRNGAKFDIYYNGTRVPYMNLDRINAMDVQSIEILTSISKLVIYGRGPTPIILITTKRGVGYLSKKNQNLHYDRTTINPKGFYTSKVFYVPKYQVIPSGEKNNDRTTVYWKPDIIPNEEGNVFINFDNAYTIGKYRVLIEGVSNSGKLARTSFTYTITNEL